MLRKIAITLAVFLIVGVGVYGAGRIVNASVGLPHPIVPDSPCPVVGCANGSCHGFDNVPKPDGVHEMSCPEVSCASLECHAWNTLETRYYQPSDSSLNLWILAPVVLIVGLVIIVRKM